MDDELRSRVIKRDLAQRSEARFIDDGNGSRKAIQREDPRVSGVKHDAGRTFANRAKSKARVVGEREGNEIRRAEASAVGAGCVATHHDATRITNGQQPLQRGNVGLRVIDMRIQVAARTRGGSAGSKNRRLDANELSSKIRLETHLVLRLGSHGNHASVGRHRERHWCGHKSLCVGGRQRVGVDDRNIVAGEIP